jgi:hypothetical protein
MTTLKNNLLTLLLLVSSTAIYAQDYDLNSYDFRYQKLRGLTFDFDLNSNGDQFFRNRQDITLGDSTFNEELNIINALSIQPAYFARINTEPLQRTINAGISNSLDANFFKDTRNDLAPTTTALFSNNFAYNFSLTDRYYKKDRFKYLEVHTSGLFFNSAREDQEFGRTTNLESEADINNNSRISIGFGRGRLDLVTDPVQAIFLLEDLQSLDGVQYTNSQIEEIAKGITAIRNARYLDFRLGYKEQIRMLDSVLTSNGIDNSEGIDYFTIMSDNWLYGNRFQRVSGKRWTHFLTLQNGYGSRRNLDERIDLDRYYLSVDNTYTASLKLNTEYTTSKQKSLNVQVRKGFEASTELQLVRSNDFSASSTMPIEADTVDRGEISKELESITNLNGRYVYLYQANTRNLLTVDVRPSLRIFHEPPEFSANPLNGLTRIDVDPRLLVLWNYYHWFSPQLSLNIGGIVRSSLSIFELSDPVNQVKAQSTQLGLTLRAGLTYQLF